MQKHLRYQDYAIKDGKLVGDFEDMYRDFDDPWEQGTREKGAFEKKIGLEIIKDRNFHRPLELGCGLGNYTRQLQAIAGAACGIDISETAIAKAKESYPQCDFYVGDVLDIDLYKKFSPDCIMCIEITWYILDKLDYFKSLLTENFGGGSTAFFHTLMTYRRGEQQYGKDYFEDLTGIMANFSSVIDITDWGEISNTKYNGGRRTFFYGVIK